MVVLGGYLERWVFAYEGDKAVRAPIVVEIFSQVEMRWRGQEGKSSPTRPTVELGRAPLPTSDVERLEAGSILRMLAPGRIGTQPENTVKIYIVVTAVTT
jgi:hypothetical protein